jgi:archaellum component FlaG (FlaF/FlaG flagellin family)
MPTNTASHLIFFIAAIFIALAVVGAITLVMDSLIDSIENRAETEQKAIRSRVEIVNDAAAMPYNNTSKTVDIYVKNIGRERLDPNQTLILIDGVNKNYTYKIVGGSKNWTQGLTVIFTVKSVNFTANSDHTVKVICDNGALDKKAFKIGSLP